MYTQNRLKPDSSISGLIPAMLCLLIAALIWIFAGKREAFLSVSVFFILYAAFSFWVYLRTVNISYFAASVWQFLVGVFIVTRKDFPLIFGPDPIVSDLVIVILLSSTVWLLYLVFTRKAKWKGREVFELASMQIQDDTNGFTSRPRPVGKTEYSLNELKDFAYFMKRNLIAMPFEEESKITFVPVKGGDEFRFLFNPAGFRQKRTWIAFDFEGNITVNISRTDYLNYKDALSFDQLCENLGKLFAEFMIYYKKGEAGRIIYKLDELRLSVTS
jgi:hypothetical protein